MKIKIVIDNNLNQTDSTVNIFIIYAKI